MLGLGEKETELFQTMDDLRDVGCEVLTIGQYLRPSAKHLPVVEYITPEQFDYYGDIARRKGIRARCFRTAGAQLVSRGRFSSGLYANKQTASRLSVRLQSLSFRAKRSEVENGTAGEAAT